MSKTEWAFRIEWAPLPELAFFGLFNDHFFRNCFKFVIKSLGSKNSFRTSSYKNGGRMPF